MTDQDRIPFDPRIADWLEGDPNTAPVPTLEIVLAAFPSIKQRHGSRLPWRFSPMSTSFKLALGAMAVIAVVLGGAYVLGPPRSDRSVGGQQTASPSLTASPVPSPSVASKSDTAGWTTYGSRQYGFSIGHPADWTVGPASRAWTWDDAKEFLNPGQENFRSPDGQVRVSAWTVAIDPDTSFEGWADLEAWVDTYCQRSDTGPCAGIHDRVVPLCLERRDCHPGLLVPFDTDVQAFFTNGAPGEDITVVVVWWGDSEPAVAPYGGSKRLLERYLSTMNVWPADETYPESRDAAATFLTTGP